MNGVWVWVVWAKVKHLVPALRERRKNPHLWKNLEVLAEHFEAWMEKRAPDALEVFRQQVVNATPPVSAPPKV